MAFGIFNPQTNSIRRLGVLSPTGTPLGPGNSRPGGSAGTFPPLQGGGATQDIPGITSPARGQIQPTQPFQPDRERIDALTQALQKQRSQSAGFPDGGPGATGGVSTPGDMSDPSLADFANAGMDFASFATGPVSSIAAAIASAENPNTDTTMSMMDFAGQMAGDMFSGDDPSTATAPATSGALGQAPAAMSGRGGGPGPGGVGGGGVGAPGGGAASGVGAGPSGSGAVGGGGTGVGPGPGDPGVGGPSGSGGAGGGDGGGKVVCTAMNAAYGFGGFRNVLWLRYAQKNLTPHHETGYHAIFRPLVQHAYERQGFGHKALKAFLEHTARHRTADIWAEMRGRKRDPVGRAERMVLEPLCGLVGRIIAMWRA